eukprot:SAG31_NODE_6472_length_2004_cov_1.939633_1_plen_181_part_00
MRDEGGGEDLTIALDEKGRIIIDPYTFQAKSATTTTKDGARTKRVGAALATVYAVGDCVAKPAGRYLASYAHWEAEFVAASLRQAITDKICREESPLSMSTCSKRETAKFQAPAQFLAISLGRRDGLLLINGTVVLGGHFTGGLVPLVKALLRVFGLGWVWRCGLSPNPYWLFRHWPAAD